MKKIVARLLGSAALLAPLAAMAQSAPSDFTTGTRYDLAHRVVGTIMPDPDGAGPLHHLAVRNTYDANGRLTLVEKGELAAWQPEGTAPASWSGFSVQQKVEATYDGLDRKVKETVSGRKAVTDPWEIGHVTQYSYDSVGRLQCTAVRMDPALFSSLPTSACSQSNPSNPIDRITKNTYDAGSQLLQVRKAVGSNLEQAYATYSYTPNGKQEYVLDANGNKARLVYDGHDRQTQWQFPSATAPTGYNPSTPANALATSGAVNTNDREEYGYDLNGNRTSLRKRDGRVFGYTFDALNRMTAKIVPTACVAGYACTNVPASMARSVYYSYDARGLQTAARFDSASGADAVTQVYDGFGRITSSTTSMSGVSRTLSYLYDADGNRTRVTQPDSAYFAMDYDGLDRMSAAQWWGSGSGTVPFMGITYDPQGRRSGIGRASSSTGYGYDAVSRLSSLSQNFAGSVGNLNTSLGYNPASQIVSQARDNMAFSFSSYVSKNLSYAANGLNQYSTVASNAYGYDSNGNLTSDGGIAYTYDAENRLVVVSTGTQLIYDPLGRLYETYSPGTGATRFLYDGDKLAAEYNGSGVLVRRYMFGPNVDEPILVDEGGALNCSGTKVLHVDHQGSVIAQADCWGNRTAINSYDEYGVPAGSNQGRFQYTGQAWIPELGMYYYKARIYAPMLGRFMQTDPIGYKDQVNLYAYAENDPVNVVDSSGQQVRALYSNSNNSIFLVDTDTHRAVFTRAESGGQPSGDPIPTGKYDILAREGKNQYYRLERHDDRFGDDETPEGRSRLRLHSPGQHGLTVGCIKVCAPGIDRLFDIIGSTSKTTATVDSKSWLSWAAPTETVDKFGILDVLPSNATLNLDNKTGAVSVRWRSRPQTGSIIDQREVYICTMKEGICK